MEASNASSYVPSICLTSAPASCICTSFALGAEEGTNIIAFIPADAQTLAKAEAALPVEAQTISLYPNLIA